MYVCMYEEHHVASFMRESKDCVCVHGIICIQKAMRDGRVRACSRNCVRVV